MIFDLNLPEGGVGDIEIVEKTYTQAVKNMERVYLMKNQMQSPDAKMFVQTLSSEGRFTYSSKTDPSFRQDYFLADA